MARKETQKIKSRPGLFGTTIHYDEKGRKIGESSPGLFGATVHTDAKGKTVGKSYGGLFGSTNHYDAKGHRMGRTDSGLFGTSTHRDEKGRQIGKSTPSFWEGTDTKLAIDFHKHKATDPKGRKAVARKQTTHKVSALVHDNVKDERCIDCQNQSCYLEQGVDFQG